MGLCWNSLPADSKAKIEGIPVAHDESNQPDEHLDSHSNKKRKEQPSTITPPKKKKEDAGRPSQTAGLETPPRPDRHSKKVNKTNAEELSKCKPAPFGIPDEKEPELMLPPVSQNVVDADNAMDILDDGEDGGSNLLKPTRIRRQQHTRSAKSKGSRSDAVKKMKAIKHYFAELGLNWAEFQSVHVFARQGLGPVSVFL